MPSTMDDFSAPSDPPQRMVPFYQGSANLYACVAPDGLVVGSFAFAANQRITLVINPGGIRYNLLRVLLFADAPTIAILYPTGRAGEYVEGYCSSILPLYFDFGPTGFNKGFTGDGIDLSSGSATTIHYNLLFQSQPYDIA